MRKQIYCLVSMIVFALAAGASAAQQPPQEKEQAFWQKLEAALNGGDRNLHDTGNP